LPQEKQIFPHPANIAEDFMNNMRYLDDCLREYVTALGSGTTIFLYADHPTEVSHDDFERDRVGGREFIPCMIYDSDQDLSLVQKTRDDPDVVDGSLNQIDIVNELNYWGWYFGTLGQPDASKYAYRQSLRIQPDQPNIRPHAD
jgi:hypothetical protein